MYNKVQLDDSSIPQTAKKISAHAIVNFQLFFVCRALCLYIQCIPKTVPLLFLQYLWFLLTDFNNFQQLE